MCTYSIVVHHSGERFGNPRPGHEAVYCHLHGYEHVEYSIICLQKRCGQKEDVDGTRYGGLFRRFSVFPIIPLSRPSYSDHTNGSGFASHVAFCALLC
jgi:hypothetical protein